MAEDLSTELRSAFVGAIAFVLLAIIKPETIINFLLWAITGIFLSMFFLVPIDRAIVTGKLKIREITCFVIGFFIFLYMFLFVYENLTEGVIFLLEWIVIYNLISIFISLIGKLLS